MGAETRNWQDGKCLIFDDTVKHEAWNYSDKTRIVLLVDFKKPEVRLDSYSQVTCSAEVADLVRQLTSN